MSGLLCGDLGVLGKQHRPSGGCRHRHRPAAAHRNVSLVFPRQLHQEIQVRRGQLTPTIIMRLSIF